MTTKTTTELPEVTDLPALDSAALRARAEAWINRIEMTVKDPRERLRLYAEADADATTASAHLDAVVYTIQTRYRLRYGANLAAALGTNRSGTQLIKRRTLKNPPAIVPDAPAVLPEAAARAKERIARRDLARGPRDNAIAELIASGVRNSEIAELIDRDPSRVSHIKTGKGAAA